MSLDPSVLHERCAQEPVHLISRIQPHGLLFALSEPDLVVRQVSANVAGILGQAPEDILGRSIEETLGFRQFIAFKAQLREIPACTPLLVHLAASRGGVALNCLTHRQDGVLLAEFELVEGAYSLAPIDIDRHIRIPLSRLEIAPNLLELARAAAAEIQSLSGFDRVMVYRFDAAWNGEVLAEVKEPSSIPYLGLRFPASDIPAQARALFIANPFRAIADVQANLAAIVPEMSPLTGRPLDLTRSMLRAASPVHLKYLENMGVRSSMTISLMVKGALWGMLACHSAEPRRVHRSTRSACELVGQVLSSQIALRSDNAELQTRLASRKLLHDYMEEIESSASLAAVSHLQSAGIARLFAADGMLSRVNGAVSSLGPRLSPELLTPILAALRQRARRGIASSHKLSELHPQAAGGALYLGLDENAGDYVLLLRGEIVETVKWAGNPHSAVTIDDMGGLHPRESFAAWEETVRGQSVPWTDIELENASLLREQLLRVRDAQKAETLRQSEETSSYILHSLR